MLRYYLWREFNVNPQSFSRNHDEFSILFTWSVWIHYLLCDFSPNQLSISLFYYNFNIYFAISLWIHYIFSEFTLSALSVSRFYYIFTICFANFQGIHYPLRKINMNSLSVSWIHPESTFFRQITLILLSNSPWIHYLFCETTIYSLWNNHGISMTSLWIHF